MWHAIRNTIVAHVWHRGSSNPVIINAVTFWSCDTNGHSSLAEKERSMDFARGYDYHRDELSGMWQIISPSGHLLYESRWHVHVARVCQRLNARFAAPPSAIDGRRFNPPPMMQAALLA
jgi:hypothetical protein